MGLRWIGIVVLVLGMAATASAWAEANDDSFSSEACLSPAQTRDLVAANKLVRPFKVMRDTAVAVRAEAIDILLCRVRGTLVYDVTLLEGGGRVFHRLIDASTGVARPDAAFQPQPRPAPRPFAGGPRPGLNFFPGGGPNPYFGPRFGPYFGPRFRPNIFPGRRFGPNGFPGPRQGAPFFLR